MHDSSSIVRCLLVAVLVMAAATQQFYSALAGTGAGENTRPNSFQADAIAPVPRPIYVYAGPCAELGEIQWPLNNLTSPDGEKGGSDDVDRTEYSFTANVPLTISQMLEGNFSINIHESGENFEASLSCGNIGGVPDAVGTLVIGLRQKDDTGITGMAVLSPSPANPALTYISVFIAGQSLGDAIGTLGVTSESPPVANGNGRDDDDDDDDGSDDDPGDDDGSDDDAGDGD